MIRKNVMTAKEAWEQLDSQAKLFVAAVNTRNSAAMLEINVKIGSLMGYVLAAKQDEDEKAYAERFRIQTPVTTQPVTLDELNSTILNTGSTDASPQPSP